MSVPRGNGQNGGHFYSNITQPVKLDLQFTVDSTNVNGLGVRSVKSNGYVEDVFMNGNVPLAGPRGAAGALFNRARAFAVLGATAVTNTGASVLTGNLGIYPGSAITGFPPGTFTGSLNVANVVAQNAKSDAQAAYTAMQAIVPTIIATALDGQNLVPGTYRSAGGTFTLAGAGAGTLTLTGTASDVWILQTTTTLTTGAGGIPTITLAGGALASNVYWVVGSSATLDSGTAGTFKGNVIALTSITDTLGSAVLGSMIALNGAVTLSAATAVTTQPLAPSAAATAAGNPNPALGYVMIRFTNNYNYFLGDYSTFIAPTSGTNIAVNAANLTLGQPYVITVVGTTTLAQWQALGLPAGFTPTVGQSFFAIATGTGAGTGQVQSPVVSGINSIEVIGLPSTEIANSSLAVNGGAVLLLQLLANGVVAAPTDGTVVSLSVCFDASSVTIDGL